LHEGLDFLQGKAAIFIGVHRLEDALVGRLKLLKETAPSPSLSIMAKSIRIIMPPCILPTS
jgi:hypothetical protein